LRVETLNRCSRGVALLFAALVASVACAPLPEETSASAPSVASSTVVLAGVELSAPLGAIVLIEEGVDWSAQSVVIGDGETLRHFALTLWGSVTRTSLASAHSGDVGEGGVSDSWCAELRSVTTHPTPDWLRLAPIARPQASAMELDPPEIPDDLGREYGPNNGAYRPFALAASGADLAIAWVETNTDMSIREADGAVIVTLSNASTDELRASLSLTSERWVPCNLHTLRDWNGDGRPELALTGEVCRGERSRECWTVEVVVLDGASLVECARAKLDPNQIEDCSRIDATWASSPPDVVGFALLGRGVERALRAELDIRRQQTLRIWRDTVPETRKVWSADRSFAGAALRELVVIKQWDSATSAGRMGGHYRWAVLGDADDSTSLIEREGLIARDFGYGSLPDAWWLPDWDGDGHAEVLCTDEASGLAVHPSRRPGESLHVLAPPGWTVDGLGSSVVIHEGRVLLSTAAVSHADNSRWRAVFELRPRMAAPDPVGR